MIAVFVMNWCSSSNGRVAKILKVDMYIKNRKLYAIGAGRWLLYNSLFTALNIKIQMFISDFDQY